MIKKHGPVYWLDIRVGGRRIRKLSGVEFHFHLLRHFFTTSLVERGVDIITVGSLLGHSRTTTSLIYSHTDTKKKIMAVKLLD